MRGLKIKRVKTKFGADSFEMTINESFIDELRMIMTGKPIHIMLIPKNDYLVPHIKEHKTLADTSGNTERSSVDFNNENIIPPVL